jgi:hypothetical protein
MATRQIATGSNGLDTKSRILLPDWKHVALLMEKQRPKKP